MAHGDRFQWADVQWNAARPLQLYVLQSLYYAYYTGFSFLVLEFVTLLSTIAIVVHSSTREELVELFVRITTTETTVDESVRQTARGRWRP